jgi:hypothetical protein
MSLYATQASAGTENASSALATGFVIHDVLEVCLKVNGTTSVDYYWGMNGGAWSSATNLTTNLPTNGTNVSIMGFSVSNQNTASATTIHFQSGTYSR